jgi:hypothetical protein
MKNGDNTFRKKHWLLISIPVLLGIGTSFVLDDRSAATWVFAGAITGIGVFLGLRR